MWSCAHGAECCFIVGLIELFKTFGRIFLICEDISLISNISVIILRRAQVDESIAQGQII